MSLLAIIDYSLILIFFICIIVLLLLNMHSRQLPTTTLIALPSVRESPGTYLFLAVLFLLFIVLTVRTQKR